jgi:glycosyltransferase involved in cell wall biosynthesis
VKVLHLESGLHLYGGAAQVAGLVAGLKAADVESLLVCRPDSVLATTVTACEVATLLMRGDLDVSLSAKLRGLIEHWRPDLVHVHSRRGADLFGGLAARRAGVPAVVTRRVESAEPAFWLRYKYRPYSAVVAISGRISKMLVQRAGIAASRVHTVPSGVDVDRFRPSSDAATAVRKGFGLPPDALVLAVVAQLIVRKGHRLLLGILPELLARHPRVHLLLFGQGPLQASLQRSVQRLDVADRVRFAGFRTDLPALLPGVDVVVHPAQREGLGVALLEAMSAGVPVVASRAGGIVDVIRDGVDGLLVPPGDGSALVAALDSVLTDAPWRRAMASAARQRIAEHFSTAAMCAGNLAIYRKVLDEA